jgi:hypothetical protein
MVREKLSSLIRFLSHMLKPNRSNRHKLKFYLISGIRLVCKFAISYIKGKKNKIIFLIFLKYWPHSCDFNKLVIKAENAC